jgi:hypothetical protein
MSYNADKTKVELIEHNNTVGIHVSNSSLHFNVTYNMELDPNILSDIGHFSFGIDELSVNLIFGMKPRPSDPRRVIIEVAENNIDLDATLSYAKLNNTNDFGYVALKVLTVLRVPIAKFLVATLQEYLEVSFNTLVAAIPIPMVFNDTTLDLSLLKIPTISDNYLPIMSVGKFSPTGQELPFTNNASVPIYEKGGESLQIFISDFTLRSFTYTMKQLGYLNVTCKLVLGLALVP